MQFITDAIQNGDYCSLVFFSLVAMFVGDRMINSQATLRVWGLRTAAIAFVGFAIAHVSEVGSPSAEDLAMAAIVGLLGGLVALGPAWIILSILGFAGGYYRRASASAGSAAHRRQLDREKRAAEKKKQQDQIEWERRAPDRERANQEASQLREAENRKKGEAQKRRSDARADCEMLFQLYAVDISSRFPRESLDEWIKKYMGDDQTPDDVEHRAEQLRKMIIHHREQVRPTPKFATLPELAIWFQSQKEQIDQLPVDDRLKRMLTANLNVRNAELMNQLLGDV